MSNEKLHRQLLQLANKQDQFDVLRELTQRYGMSLTQRELAVASAAKLVGAIRSDGSPGLMEQFLAEYGLSSDEGVALMCLAEALLRVPDSETMDELIEDKIVPSSWGEHLGKSSSSLVNAATWGLMLTGKILSESEQESISSTLKGAIKRLGEPVIRLAVKQAMKEMGQQFVLGETIESAIDRGENQVSKGYTYSFDMLGEAALTAKDADHYYQAYEHSINALGAISASESIRDNPGISIKLSALHPRYEGLQTTRVIKELVPKVIALAKLAKRYQLGLNIDAEEADRLDLSLEVISAVLADPSLESWDGFGVVVQAYNKSATHFIDYLYELASQANRKIMVRLVKGAYWDSEIKHAQVMGLENYPVYTEKWASDVAYLCCAQQLLNMQDRVYPQFATHNAHTIEAIRVIAADGCDYEFQRLHGMGEAAYRILMNENRPSEHNEAEKAGIRCRIYAPVGEHRDLLAYLVRRLLENGANSSFVNQIVDEAVPVEQVVADPFVHLQSEQGQNESSLALPSDLYFPNRFNSKGFDLNRPEQQSKYQALRQAYKDHEWFAEPLLACEGLDGDSVQICNPANPHERVGQVRHTHLDDVESAANAAEPWAVSGQERAEILNAAADLYEQNAGEIFALLAREAGKTANDAVAELREAVDFLRYYAEQGEHDSRDARGLVVCISPWNFPLAIFTGQLSAALAAGNAVIAKPAESTPLIAHLAIRLLHQAGVPRAALQYLPGLGSDIGAQLCQLKQVNGVCFTGSTATAQGINRSMAQNMSPEANLIAETGGINAMIVDSTALPEQAIQDIVRSAFQSAGQRCSALRVLYVQDDIAEHFTEMLCGAMDELELGDPWALSCDVGPIINRHARDSIAAYVEKARQDGKVIKQTASLNSGLQESNNGYFIAPTVLRVSGLAEVKHEVFGPILHLATFSNDELDDVITAINESAYGLTFGLHTRIDGRVEQLTRQLKVGNAYVNRDQIGAIVGTQPFGGEGLSGTGPKAGGPDYVARFKKPTCLNVDHVEHQNEVQSSVVQVLIDGVSVNETQIDELSLTGPTGESNRLRRFSFGIVLCLGPDLKSATTQAEQVEANHGTALIVCPGANGEHSIDGYLSPEALSELTGFAGVALWSSPKENQRARIALAKREGPILPLFVEADFAERCTIERHLCINTTASGGNVALLAS